jgi:nucleotide-binding universal stress UspA family protein
VQEQEGWVFDTLVLDGDPVDVITQVAEKTGPDVIVMATSGHNGFMDVVRGSVTERVCRELSIPLLAIPQHVHLL